MALSVLLADDNDGRDRPSVTEAFLVGYGFDVVRAATVADAIRLVHEEPRDVAVVVARAFEGRGHLVAETLAGTSGGQDLSLVLLSDEAGSSPGAADAVLSEWPTAEELHSVLLILTANRESVRAKVGENQSAAAEAPSHGPLKTIFRRAQEENFYQLLGADSDASTSRLVHLAERFSAAFGIAATAEVTGPARLLASCLAGLSAEMAFVFDDEERRAAYDVALMAP